MTGKTKKRIGISILIVVLLCASVGYYLYQKGPLDVKSSPAIKVNAAGLYDQFSKDSTGSLKKYSGKVVEVTGVVSSVSLNQQKQQIILLKTPANGAFVNCTMEESAGNVHANDNVNIKGICSGIGQGDEDLGIKADLYLTRCFLIK